MLKTALALVVLTGGLVAVAAASESPGEESVPRFPSSTISGCTSPPRPGDGITVLGRVLFSAGQGRGEEVQTGGRNDEGYRTTKQPVIIKGVDSVVLRIPTRLRDSVLIAGWGRNDAKYTASVVRIRLDEPCLNGQWAAYAGGFNFRGKHCLKLQVEADGRRAVVPFGLGKPCASEGRRWAAGGKPRRNLPRA